MQVVELIYRQQQQSLISEESSEVRTLLRVSHEGQTGLLRIDSDYYKRDCESTIYCDCPGVDLETIDESGIDESWHLEPQHTTETPDIKAMIVSLADHQLSSDA